MMVRMPAAFIYDDASYHEGAPAFLNKRLSRLNSGTHIGMFIAWVVMSRLESFQLRQIAPDGVEQLRSRQKTGRAFLFEHCEGKLTSDALNSEANAFAVKYYESLYLRDYDQVLLGRLNSTYLIADTWANYERIAAVVDQRLREFRGDEPSNLAKPAAAF